MLQLFTFRQEASGLHLLFKENPIKSFVIWFKREVGNFILIFHLP